jgi:Ca-activated chloride channel family protein
MILEVSTAVIGFSRVSLLKNNDSEFKKVLLNVLKVLKCISLILIIISLAKPQEGKTFEHSNDQGIDIIAVLDASVSMRSLDFRPLNRMEADKRADKLRNKNKKPTLNQPQEDW